MHCPNDLPIMAIRHDGLMLEHEHGDHPEYKFQVEVELMCAVDDDMRYDAKLLSGMDDLTDEQVARVHNETHAFIRIENNNAVTLFESNVYTFNVEDGQLVEGPGWDTRHKRLKHESLMKIREFARNQS